MKMDLSDKEILELTKILLEKIFVLENCSIGEEAQYERDQEFRHKQSEIIREQNGKITFLEIQVVELQKKIADQDKNYVRDLKKVDEHNYNSVCSCEQCQNFRKQEQLKMDKDEKHEVKKTDLIVHTSVCACAECEKRRALRIDEPRGRSATRDEGGTFKKFIDRHNNPGS